MKLTEHFDSSEFRCKCGCGQGDWLMAPELVQALEELRELIGKPIIVNSAYRCPKHNAQVGGVANSYHTQGMAGLACTSQGTSSTWTWGQGGGGANRGDSMKPELKSYLLTVVEDGEGYLSASRIISLLIAIASVIFVSVVLWKRLSPEYIGQVTTYAATGFGTTYGTGKIADAITDFAVKKAKPPKDNGMA